MSQHSAQSQQAASKWSQGRTPQERAYLAAMERLANAAETVIELEFRGYARVLHAKWTKALAEYDAAKVALDLARYRLEGPKPQRETHIKVAALLAGGIGDFDG